MTSLSGRGSWGWLALGLWLAGCATAQSTQTAQTAQPAATGGPVVAFVGVSVLPLDSGRVLEDQTVVVRGDRIEAMGPKASTPVPTGATQLDGRGRFLMPGLVDMHIHLQGGPHENEDGEQVPADRDEGQLALQGYLYSGITSVYDAGNDPDYILGFRNDERAGKLVAPRIFSTIGIVTYPGSHGSQALNEATPERSIVAEFGPGDAFLFLGSTLHGAGGNRSGAVRKAVVVSYCLGWLKPYENQWLTYPPAIARGFSPELAALLDGSSLRLTGPPEEATHPLLGHRIDYILAGPAWRVERAAVLHAGPSDNWPITAELLPLGT